MRTASESLSADSRASSDSVLITSVSAPRALRLTGDGRDSWTTRRCAPRHTVAGKLVGRHSENAVGTDDDLEPFTMGTVSGLTETRVVPPAVTVDRDEDCLRDVKTVTNDRDRIAAEGGNPRALDGPRLERPGRNCQ